MTLPEFQQLSPALQLETLWDKGYVISEKRRSKFLHVLYSIFDFYVELKYTAKSVQDINTTVFTVNCTPVPPYYEAVL